MKDILVDNTECGRFCNPLSSEYKAFVRWLLEEGVLVVTNGLIREYHGSASGARMASSLPAVVDRLTRDGRLNMVTKEQLRNFRISRSAARRLRSNREDHAHLKAVMLSCRKLAISGDGALRQDVNGFPGVRAKAVPTPEDVDYRGAVGDCV